jgi:hypothetical protein
VLVVEDGKGATYRKIPMSVAADNRRKLAQIVQLAPDGKATVEHEMTVTGASASSTRFAFQSPKQREERLATALADVYRGVQVEDVLAPNIGDITQPAHVTAKLKVPAWSRPDGAGQRFYVLGRQLGLASSLAGLSKRTHELSLDVPAAQEFALDYELPSGHEFSRIPDAKKIETDVGSFSLEIERTTRGATVRSTITFPKARITPKQYPAFRDFLRRVDESLEQTFEVVPQR